MDPNLDVGVVHRVRHDFGGGAPVGPVAQIPGGSRHLGAVVACLSLCKVLPQPRDLFVHMGKTGRGHEIGMRTDLAIRQILERFTALGLTNESPAHGALLGILKEND